MSIKMNLIRTLLKADKEKRVKQLNSKKTFSSISDVLTLHYKEQKLPGAIKAIALTGTKCKNINVNGTLVYYLKPNHTHRYFLSTLPEPEYLFFYVHGGGFCGGFALQGAFFMRGVMKRIGCNAMSVEYSLSPKALFPTAIEEVLECYKFALKHYDSQKIIIGGESAGANLCVSLMLKLRELNLPQPALALLSSGFFDLTANNSSCLTNEETDFALCQKELEYMARCYVDGEKLKHLGIKDRLSNPLVSPVFADLNNLPPMFFSVCDDELLYQDTILTYNNAMRDGVFAKLHVANQTFHAYMALGDFFKESSLVLNQACEFARIVLKMEKPKIIKIG